MGKSKKRIFNKNADSKGTTLKRKEIIDQILFDLRNNKINDNSKKLMSLFGITIEELAEAGAYFEELSVLKNFI